ncbi:MAG: glutamine amidotransferase [Planctomycetota bacterium]
MIFDSAISLPLAVAVVMALAAGCVGAYLVPVRQPLSPIARAALILLRMAIVAMAALLLLRPAWLKEETIREKLGLVLLADASRSMSVLDGVGGRPRYEAVKNILRLSSSQRKRLAERYHFNEYQFDRSISDLALDGYAASGNVTAIGDALTLARQQVTVGNMAGVILLTDGANNFGRDPDAVARDFGSRKIPIYPVVIGKEEVGEAVRDVKVESLDLSSSAFARSMVPVTAEIRFVYCQREKVKVVLQVDDKPAGEQVVSVAGPDMTHRVDFAFTPDTPGPRKITVRAEPVKGEIITTNNSMSSYIHVLTGGLKALYIDRPRSEFKFLRQAFAEGKDIQLTTVTTLGEKIAAPKSQADWKQFDAVLFGDVPADVFSLSQLRALELAVSQNGIGFGMIAGARNFSAGGYARSPVAKLLPVTLEGETPFQGEYRLNFTPAGLGHFMARLDKDPEANQKAWAEVRPLAGGIQFSGAKPGAHVLACGPKNEPILVVQQYGKGRTLAFAADTTWRWAFAEKDTKKFHRRFWRQVLLWLGDKEGLGRANVWIGLQSLRVVEGEQMEVRVHVEDSLGRDVSDAKVEGEIVPPDGESAPLSFRLSEDQYVAPCRPAKAGDYQVKVKAYGPDGALLGEDMARFLAYVPEVELERPAANPAAMARLASLSGGKPYTAETVQDLFKELLSRDASIEIKRTEPQPIWSSRWVLYIFLAALTLEWIVRKTQRLV